MTSSVGQAHYVDLDLNASGKCVLSWGSGTKAVSATSSWSRTGRVLRYTTFYNLPAVHVTYFSLLGYDDALYNHRLCGGLRGPWHCWQVAAFGSDPDMLGSPVCKTSLTCR
jgi:hypothetical protein